MGIFQDISTFWTQSFPPKSKFSVGQIPDLTNRVYIVTGGSGGVGYETVKALLAHNAKVYIAARNKAQIKTAIETLKAATGKEALGLELDLSSLVSVRRAAKEFLSKERELHVLFNNAGVMTPPINMVTADGYDLQFGTNVVGHFYFGELLMPALLAGKETSPDGHARIITTASGAAYLAGPLNWDVFVDGPARVGFGISKLYYQSKSANVIVARHIAQRYADKGILSMSCNPGNLKSGLQRYVSFFERWVNVILLWPVSYGALTQLWGGLMPETIQYNGQFLIPWARVGRAPEYTYEPE
ncbi:hypothetical protein EUX98_g9467, partial [Antrodiella citrinella]